MKSSSSDREKNAARTEPRFDIEALRKLAGTKSFARGKEYHDEGSVEILALEPDRVLAEVEGNEDYRTVARGHGSKIAAEQSAYLTELKVWMARKRNFIKLLA